jgi:competence/damage-inducible protein CinA C-terminal domain
VTTRAIRAHSLDAFSFTVVIVEVLNTGTELLLGNILNSHLAFFGRSLFPLGLRISRQTTVPDGIAIRDALVEAMGRCDVLLVTGGLGPTTDDITREIVAELLGRRLEVDPAITEAIRARCELRGYPFLERMHRQTMVPQGAVVLPNANGTAPGLYLPAEDTAHSRTPHLFLLPGPPRELIPMFEDSVLPRLGEWTASSGVECRIYRCVGIGESQVEDRIGLRLSAVPGLEVGYCARPNEVDLRLIGSPPLLDEIEPQVLAELGAKVLATDERLLEAVVVDLLRERRSTVAVAESCTGGQLANRFTNVPGASEVFLAGYVTYANEAKSATLGVDPALIERNGAVSEPVARAMAEGALERSGANFALSTTGIAGPGGGSPEKPVGTVFLALAEKGRETRVWRQNFASDRETFKQLASQAALDALRLRLLGAE